MRSYLLRCASVTIVVVAIAQVAGTTAVRAGPPNRPPVAVHDVAEVVAAPGAGATIDVLANDFDPDGDALLVIAVGQAGNGSTFVNSRGFPNYTPNPGFGGLDSFAYTLADGRGLSSTGTVFVAVSSLTPACDFRRGTTTCTTEQLDLVSTERTVTSGCVAGPGAGTPGVRVERFVETNLITIITLTRRHGRNGSVFETTTTTSTDHVHTQLVSSTCESL